MHLFKNPDQTVPDRMESKGIFPGLQLSYIPKLEKPFRAEEETKSPFHILPPREEEGGWIHIDHSVERLAMKRIACTGAQLAPDYLFHRVSCVNRFPPGCALL